MRPKAQYQQMIQDTTRSILFLPHVDKKEQKPTITLQCDIKLPSSYLFRSSQQIENNMLINKNITRQSYQQYPTSLQNHWPKSSIGLVLCEHYQNNQIFYVYGTGTLIEKNIVLTSAQNVYCHRLNIQYINIRFIVGVSEDKCSGIYNTKRVHYPKEYTKSDHENYNFAVLQLYDDLSDSCGYVGWKTTEDIYEDEKYTDYGYNNDNKEGFFILRSRTKDYISQQDQEHCSRVLIKENDNKYFIVGLQNLEKKYFLNNKIRNMIHQWIELTTIYVWSKKIGVQECKYLSQSNWGHLTKMKLCNIVVLMQGVNNIGQKSQYLSQVNWIHLNTIYLVSNNIGQQGCKYLSQVNWIHLNTIYLDDNKIDAQGCKYLSQAHWKYLTTISLGSNKIDAQGCKYLNQVNWKHLTTIYLNDNSIDTQGYKYLSQTNWKHLNKINLKRNYIKDMLFRLLLKQSYPNTIIKI